jgi:delta(3,5)-delta(2,4)-dienoyl-CoA isomerase
LDNNISLTYIQGLDYVAVWNAAMLQTQDVKDALFSKKEKRTPRFEKL